MGVRPIFWQSRLRGRLRWGLRAGLMSRLRARRLSCLLGHFGTRYMACDLRAGRLVLLLQHLPLARMGGDPFPRQVAYRLDAASPRIPHRR